MKKKFLQYMFLGCSLIALISSCRKDDFDNTTETGNSGTTFVYIDGAPEINQFFDVFTNIKTVKMFVIRRDAKDNADVNKEVTVNLKSLGQAYLDENAPQYDDIFATDIYTMPTSADIASGNAFTGSEGITKTADGLTIKFAAGEVAKNVYFKVNGSKVDLSKQYAAAFATTDFGGFTKKVGQDTLLTSIAIKNAYDGIYTIAGTITRYTDGTSAPDTDLGGDYPTGDDALESQVATTSATTNTLQLFWKTGGGISGIDGLQIAVDPATKLVTVTAPGSPGSLLANTPGQENYYDPGTKTLHLHFTWGAVNKRIANVTLTYKGAR